MAQTAGHLLVIERGKMLTDGPVEEVIDSLSGTAVRVRSPQATELAKLVSREGVTGATNGRQATT